MRLFVALPLGTEALDMLAAMQKEVRRHAQRVDITPTDNLHLTLAFIGETDKAEAAVACVQATKAAAFAFAIEGIGRFRRDGGDLLWAGVGKNLALERLQAQVASLLHNAGFRLEERKFRPHLTLARRAVFHSKKDFLALQSLFPQGRVTCQTCGEWVSLFCSECGNGRQIYTEMATKRLEL